MDALLHFLQKSQNKKICFKLKIAKSFIDYKFID